MAPPSRHRVISFTSATLVALVALVLGFGGGWLVRRDTTTTPRPVPTTSSTAPTTTTAPLADCVGTSLHGTQAGSLAAAGTVQATFTVTDEGASPCTLDGSPQLQLLDANGATMTTTAIDGGADFTPATANLPASEVRLSPGTSAVFVIEFTDVPAGTESVCPQAASFNAYPPTSATPFTVPFAFAPCDAGTVHVSPFFLTA